MTEIDYGFSAASSRAQIEKLTHENEVLKEELQRVEQARAALAVMAEADARTVYEILYEASFRLVWAVDGKGETTPGNALRAVKALGEAFAETQDALRLSTNEGASLRAFSKLANERGDILATYDEKKLTSRAVDELRRRNEYMGEAISLIFYALNHKASRKPDRDLMQAAATVRGQAEYFRENGFVPDEKERADAAEAKAKPLTLALRNVRAVANRMRRRMNSDAESVDALLRYCADAGITDQILRASEETEGCG